MGQREIAKAFARDIRSVAKSNRGGIAERYCANTLPSLMPNALSSAWKKPWRSWNEGKA